MNTDAIELEFVTCDCCGGTSTEFYMKPVWDLPVMADEVAAVRCTTCGLIYLNPRPTQRSITSLYEKYYGSTPKETSSLQKGVRANRILRRLWHWYCGQYLGEVLDKARGVVLDVGCGTGDLLEELKKKGCDVHGVELNSESVNICKERGLDVRCENFDTLSFPDQMFDTVILWHVIEHLASPQRALEKIRRVLKPGGRLYVYCPNINSYMARFFGPYWFAWHIPFHFYHFSPGTLRKIAEHSILKVNKASTVTPEFCIKYSLDLLMRHNGGPLSRIILRSGIIRTFFFRISVAPFLRLLDFMLQGKGTYLEMELEK
jgi:2-polyprenyl-3-methyl-5-hydroxy-6-metoxy-1,4-benzoquinol methylase